MKQPPAFARMLLNRLGPRDQSLVGDLYEEYGTGRSRTWLWRQVIASIAYGAAADIRSAPLRTSVAIATGWAVAAAVFLLGDRIADGLAGFFWQWNRQTAYADDVWWPFYVGRAARDVCRLRAERGDRRASEPSSTRNAAGVRGVDLYGACSGGAGAGDPHRPKWPFRFRTRCSTPSSPHSLPVGSGILLVPVTMLLSGTMAVRHPDLAARGEDGLSKQT